MARDFCQRTRQARISRRRLLRMAGLQDAALRETRRAAAHPSTMRSVHG